MPTPKTEVAPIQTYWERDEKSIKGEKLKLALRRLQTQGEQYLIEAQSEMLEAESAFNKARLESVKSPNFSGIVEAAMRVKRAKLSYETAQELYKSEFGTAPKI